jgi:hypothetical protein
MSGPCTSATMTSIVTTAVEAYTIPVGAALCRDRAAKRPHNFNIDAQIAGAALRPDRDTRPLGPFQSAS